MIIAPQLSGVISLKKHEFMLNGKDNEGVDNDRLEE